MKNRAPITEVLISWRDMLEAIPVRNEAVGAKESSQRVQLKIVKKRPRFLVPPLSWIISPRLHKTLELDRIGSEIFRLCDGCRRVEQIVDAFGQAHGLSFHEARAAVTDYLRILVQKGVLVMARVQKDGISQGRVGACNKTGGE